MAGLLIAIAVVSLSLTGIYVNQREKGEQEDTFRVVTSFYPMYIASMNIVDGVDNVVLENLSEPQTGCLHDYQLTPADMVLLSQADVFVVNGGGIENFLTEIAARYPNLTIINAGESVEMLEDNAHAWMNPEDYQIQVSAIAEGLAEEDESHANAYLARSQKDLHR